MANQAENLTVYAAGLVQGIALVTFPAASTIFTAPDAYDLSSSQYGTLFVPQVITAVTASLLGTSLARRFSSKPIYLAGLAANLASMVLLIASRVVMTDQSVAFPLLLVATVCLGVGFGLTAPRRTPSPRHFTPRRLTVRTGAQCAAGAWHRPGATLRRDLRRARVLGSSAPPGGSFADGTPGGEPGSSPADGHPAIPWSGAGTAREEDWDPRSVGCSQASLCSMVSARR